MKREINNFKELRHLLSAYKECAYAKNASK